MNFQWWKQTAFVNYLVVEFIFNQCSYRNLYYCDTFENGGGKQAVLELNSAGNRMEGCELIKLKSEILRERIITKLKNY